MRDAATLLERVADTARTTRTRRIEGSMVEITPGAPPLDGPFILAMKAPGDVRFVQTGGSEPGIVGCSESVSMVYSAVLHRYQKVSPPLNTVCGPITGDWESLPVKLMSPKLAEYRANGIEGRTPACQLIRGMVAPVPPATVRIRRTLCVDTKENIIVWDKREIGSGTTTWTFTRVERDTGLSAQELAFEPPSGGTPTIYDLPIPHHPGELIVPRLAGGTPPRVRSKVDPEYDLADRKAGVEGTVVLYVVIDVAGRPADVQVLRRQAPALDAEAVRVVRQWRFYPATKGGQPVTVMATVEVNFRRI